MWSSQTRSIIFLCRVLSGWPLHQQVRYQGTLRSQTQSLVIGLCPLVPLSVSHATLRNIIVTNFSVVYVQRHVAYYYCNLFIVATRTHSAVLHLRPSSGQKRVGTCKYNLFNAWFVAEWDPRTGRMSDTTAVVLKLVWLSIAECYSELSICIFAVGRLLRDWTISDNTHLPLSSGSWDILYKKIERIISTCPERQQQQQ